MKYEAIVFDLDGVLCSTDRFHTAAWAETAREVEAPFPLEIQEKFRGVSRMECLEILLAGSRRTFSPEEKERLATEKNERYRQSLSQMGPEDMTPAIREMLQTLRRRGLKVAFGSSSRNAVYILQRLEAERYFDAVCDGTQIRRSKPDPEVFLKAAALVDAPPERCLVVEDAAAGLEAAAAAGMDCAVVGDAPMPFSPTYALKDASELPGILFK